MISHHTEVQNVKYLFNTPLDIARGRTTREVARPHRRFKNWSTKANSNYSDRIKSRLKETQLIITQKRPV